MTISTTPKFSHPAEALILAPISADLRTRLSQIRLMVFDVDGVLTDGSLWYSRNGEIVKGFHARDGHGLKLLRESGIIVALMTGRDSPSVSRRAVDLGITDSLQGVTDKGQAILDLAQRYQIDLEQVGFMGDDLIDLPAMRQAGFSATVPQAPNYISQAAHWVSSLPGGAGAARECCDLLLAAQGHLGRFITGGSSNLMTLGSVQ